MSNQVLEKINIIQNELNELEVKKDLPQVQRVVASVIKLLDDSISIDDQNLYQLFTDDGGKIKENSHWFCTDSVLVDRRATYKIFDNNNLNIDFKLFCMPKILKGRIAWIQSLTPNFEDEPYNKNHNVGVDFVVPESADKVIIVLSNNWIIRTLELKGELTVTYQEILSKWAQISDFSKKDEVHNILWDSFDIHPLNKKFYAGISERFTLLRQYLVKEKVFDERHASLFANRLIGRIIFTWFLDKKGIVNPEIGYFDSESYEDDNEYYRERLERLFFGVLNTPIEDREYKDNQTPFLNGGLFEPRENDLYKNYKLHFPKNYFDDLFEFLSSYNFTTDESTSQFQQVAIDPEMLGRIFENLLAEMTEETGEQARKAKGAFYTPREIVDYMCRESLKEYLKTKITYDENLDQRLYQLIDAPDKDFQDQDHNWRRDWKPYKTDIMKALDELKILDPACGSGAFPIGMLQLLVKVYERLEARFSSYNTKLGIIENNIYGVDIEPMAVEIARLRAWLSIVVDEESDSKKIKPLPNLEFKFICANSLIDLDKKSTAGFGDDPELQEKIREIRDSYFKTESLNKKKKLRDEYEKLLGKGESLFGESEKSRQLKTYKPFDNESQTEFLDTSFIFGVDNFDIMIANPPYVSINQLARDKNPLITYLKSDSASLGNYFGVNLHSVPDNRKKYPPKPNLYSFFFAITKKHLSEKGILSFIVPKNLLTAKDLDTVRYFLVEDLKLLKLVALSESVFVHTQTTAGKIATSSLLVFASKNASKKEYDINIINTDLKNLNNSKKIEVKNDKLLEKILNWNFICHSPSTIEILDKYELFPDLSRYYNHGSKDKPSKHNFYFDVGFTLKKDNILASVDNPNDYFRLFEYRGIEDYYLSCSNYYPKDKNKIELTKNSQGYDVLDQKYKIIWSVKNPKAFSFTEEDVIFNMGKAALISSNDREEILFLLAILNSSLTKFILNALLKMEGEKDILVPISAIKNYIRIPNVNKIQKKQIIDICKDIVDIKINDPEFNISKNKKSLDNLILESYNFSDSEKEIINNSL